MMMLRAARRARRAVRQHRKAGGDALGKKPAGGHWNSGIAVSRNNELIEVGGAVFPRLGAVAVAGAHGEPRQISLVPKKSGLSALLVALTLINQKQQLPTG